MPDVASVCGGQVHSLPTRLGIDPTGQRVDRDVLPEAANSESMAAQSCGRSRKLGSLLTLLSNFDHHASKALSGTVSLPNDARKLKALAMMRWARTFVVTGEAVAD